MSKDGGPPREDDPGESTSRGGGDAAIVGLPFRQATSARPQYKTGPMKMPSPAIVPPVTPFAPPSPSSPFAPPPPASSSPAAAPPATPLQPAAGKVMAIPAPHVLSSRAQPGAQALSSRAQPATPTVSPSTPPPPPARVQAAPLHLDPSDWPGTTPQRAAEPVPVRDVPPPAWTQRPDWDVLAASNAAVVEAQAPPPAAAPSASVPPPAAAPSAPATTAPVVIEDPSAALRAPDGFVAPQMELVFFDEVFFPQVRLHFRVLCEDMEPDPNRSFGEDIAEVLHVLATAARPQDPKVVAQHSERRVGSGALPPLEVWDGTLVLELDPVERLRLEVESARRILKPSPELTRAIEIAQSDLDATRGITPRRALGRAKELRDHAKWSMQQDDDHALDLFERRAYRSVEVFGGRHVRGTLKVGSTTFCIYLASSAAAQLPLLPQVRVTAIAERRGRQEQDAVSDVALHVRALARHV